MKWIKKNAAVYTSDSSIISVDATDIAMLKEEVLHTPQHRIRICAHQKSCDLLHEMIIVLAKNSYIRPHKHRVKCESFHLIEGEMDVVIFDDLGNITEVIAMGDPHSGKCFFYRLSAPYFHTLCLRTPFVIFHETTNGPFNKEQTLYAPWSPSEEDQDQVTKFSSTLAQKLEIK